MIVRAQAASLWGVEALSVTVEVCRTPGLPGVSMVGLARGATKESWVRVRAALLQLGVALSDLHLIVNLVPADRPKDASTLELALAVAVLVAAGLLPAKALEGRRFWGEVALDGRLEPSAGGLLVADLVRAQQEAELVLPFADAGEAARLGGVRVTGARTLAEVLSHLRGEKILPAASPPPPPPAQLAGDFVCLGEVVGQATAKRALEVAAAGNHNLLLVGPPGSGKTMLARALRGLLPPLGCQAQSEVLRIETALALAQGAPVAAPRPHGALPPFRSPHHTSSAVALLGGGAQVRPGELTLAHQGVLFLDELPEFGRRTLEALREPLEEGWVHVARARTSITYPARTMLVAAMNPCPCGYFTGAFGPKNAQPACLCAFEQVQRYRARLSGPLLERIDLQVRVHAVPLRALTAQAERSGEPSEAVRARVSRARALQHQRLGAPRCNAQMTSAETRTHAAVAGEARSLLEKAVAKEARSMRQLSRVLRVARTIADLRRSSRLSDADVAEALTLTRGAWR